MLLAEYSIPIDDDEIYELAYADDTLLLGTSTDHLQKYLQCIANIRQNYGLSLNSKKVDQMSIRCEARDLINEDGKIIDSKSSMKYLGAQLQADGKNNSQIAQKIDEASRSFKNLKRIWHHSNISQNFKYQIFTSCVIQKLIYFLESTWLSAKIRKKFDGFRCSCLRQILEISHSFVSRISNAHILRRFNARPLSNILLERQLILYGKIYSCLITIQQECVFFNPAHSTRYP